MKLARKIIASVVTGAMLISNVSTATSVIADQTESTETEVVIAETTESNETSETSLETTANVVIDESSETSSEIEYIEETEDLIETEVTVVTEEEVISSETNTDPTDNTIVETVESTMVTEETTETSETEEMEYVVFDHYYSEINASLVSTSELFVITSDPSVFTRNTNVVSNYDDAFIIECSSVEEARFVYSYYVDKVDFITDMSDVASVASPDDTEESTPVETEPVIDAVEVTEEIDETEVTETAVPTETTVDVEETEASETSSVPTESSTEATENINEAEALEPDIADLSDLNNGSDAISNLNGIDTVHNDYSGYIALIDTGANVQSNFTVLGGDTFDHNGHGTNMLGCIRSQNPYAQVVSIKVSENGSASAADIYAGFRLAIDLNVSVINFSMTAPDIAKNAVIRDIIQEALDAGIVVIGAAGNNAVSASHFIPGCIDGVITVGAATMGGTRLSSSNYDADYYVAAESTSEATAKFTGIYTAGNLDDYIADFNSVFEIVADDDYWFTREIARRMTEEALAEGRSVAYIAVINEDGTYTMVEVYLSDDFDVAWGPDSNHQNNATDTYTGTITPGNYFGTCTVVNGGDAYSKTITSLTVLSSVTGTADASGNTVTRTSNAAGISSFQSVLGSRSISLSCNGAWTSGNGDNYVSGPVFPEPAILARQ